MRYYVGRHRQLLVLGIYVKGNVTIVFERVCGDEVLCRRIVNAA